jgi:hypothetical protein
VRHAWDFSDEYKRKIGHDLIIGYDLIRWGSAWGLGEVPTTPAGVGRGELARVDALGDGPFGGESQRVDLRSSGIDLEFFHVLNGSSAAAAAWGSSFDFRSHGFAMGYLPGAAAAARRLLGARGMCGVRCC